MSNIVLSVDTVCVAMHYCLCGNALHLNVMLRIPCCQEGVYLNFENAVLPPHGKQHVIQTYQFCPKSMLTNNMTSMSSTACSHICSLVDLY